MMIQLYHLCACMFSERLTKVVLCMSGTSRNLYVSVQSIVML